MTTGTFDAMGKEILSYRNVRFVLPTLLALSSLVLFFYGLSRGPPFLLAWTSGALLIIGVMSLQVIRIRAGAIFGEYQISVENHRDDGGDVTVSFVNAKGKRQEGLIVKKLKPHNRGMTPYASRGGSGPVFGVAGLTVKFKGSKDVDSLNLAFDSRERMKEALVMLGGTSTGF